LTMALRKGARARGAEIYEQTEVTAASRTASGEWRLQTTRGEIIAEHVVCATGNYARQTGRMFGLNMPAIPVEHQYIVYEESPELKAYRAAGGRELAVLRESDNPITCARSAWAGSSAPTKRARRRASPTEYRTGSARTCSRATSIACCRMSKQRSVACLRSSTVASKISSTDRSPTRRMAARWSVRPGAYEIFGSTKDTASASPQPVAPAGSSPNGSSRASPASTCSPSTRGASGPTPASASWSPRTKKPIATSSPCITPTRSAPMADRSRRARSTNA
ncbi:MAG: FAD-dependent oxidoreductase, partial [Gammaproteobacteria bacterium]|nr:FAD-dependent oxidoreductase [Gammaproteobacteria bacterium]